MRIAVIRIKGRVGLNKEINETLYRMRLRKKYSCVVFEEPNEAQMGMIKSLRNFVSFGEISDETNKKLLEKRGKKDSSEKGKIKPFFSLHPPRGGAKTKWHAPKGILGENKEMDKLIERML
jgi:large subunit ribosomal protein L30